MSLIHKIKIFIFLDVQTKLLFLEAFMYLGWARVLMLLPFTKIAPSLGVYMQETPNRLNEENRAMSIKIYQAIRIVSNYTFWESKCLVKAIAGMKMLEKRKMDSTLYLGTAKDENGKMIAHAWLRSGPYFITGADGKEKFTVVGTFAKRISNEG